MRIGINQAPSEERMIAHQPDVGRGNAFQSLRVCAIGFQSMNHLVSFDAEHLVNGSGEHIPMIIFSWRLLLPKIDYWWCNYPMSKSCIIYESPAVIPCLVGIVSIRFRTNERTSIHSFIYSEERCDELQEWNTSYSNFPNYINFVFLETNSRTGIGKEPHSFRFEKASVWNCSVCFTTKRYSREFAERCAHSKTSFVN